MNPDPITAWNVVLVLVVLASLSVNLITLSRMNKTQKRDVTIQDGGVPKGEHDQLVKRVDRIEVSIEAMRSDMRRDRIEGDQTDEQRASRLHKRIDEVHERINGLDKAVADVPHQTMALLTNAKALNKESRQ